MLHRRVCLLAGLLIALAPVAAEGRSWQVAPGEDYRPLLSQLKAGDELVFLPGVHEGPAEAHLEGTPAAPIVLRGQLDAEGNRPRLSFTGRGHSLWRIGGSHIVIRDLEFHATHHYGMRLDRVQNVRIENCVFRDCGGGDLSANSAEVDGLVIRSCRFLGGRRTPVYIGRHDGSLPVRGLVFENNVIDGSQIEAVGIGYGIQLKLNVTGGIVRNNIIGGTRGPGIMVYGAQEADMELANQVEGNLVFGARNNPGIVVGGGPAVVRDNIVLGSPGGGISVMDYGKRGLVRLVRVVRNTAGLNARFDLGVTGHFTEVSFQDNLVLNGSRREPWAALPEAARGPNNRLAAAPPELRERVEQLQGRLHGMDAARYSERAPRGPVSADDLAALLEALRQ